MNRSNDTGTAVALIFFIAVLWLGFLMHQSSTFAGSAMGGIFAVAAALLMLVPFTYTFIKRIPSIRKCITTRISMRYLIQIHTYTGFGAVIFALIHTGHKFQSTLGFLLTALVLLVVFSGFVGRYLLGFITENKQDRKNHLETLRAEYQQRVTAAIRSSSSIVSTDSTQEEQQVELLPLIESIADLEYAVTAEDRLKRVFSYWLYFHIFASVLLFVLLGLHIWSAIEFGLRWFL